MQPPRINHAPDNEWVPRLRHGNIVYAPKEDRYLIVDFAYEPPDMGHHRTGRIGLQYLWFENGEWGVVQDGWRYHAWHIKPDGRGFDGNHILLPCDGQCDDAPPEMSEPWVRQVERRIANLEARIDQLEAAAHTHHEAWDEGF